MTIPPEFDGPRLVRPDELRASYRLSQICFGEVSVSEDNDDESPNPVTGETFVGTAETYMIARGGVLVSQITIGELCPLPAIHRAAHSCSTEHPTATSKGRRRPALQHDVRHRAGPFRAANC